MRRPAALASALALLVALAGVSGCSPAQRVLGLHPNERPATTRPPLTASQATLIAERALQQASVADGMRTADAAKTAFTGIALRTAAATYAVQKVTDPQEGEAGSALEPATPPSRIILTSRTAFPRYFVVLSRPADQATPRLSVLVSADARTPYRVASRAQLLPGATVPATSPSGAPVPAGPATGLSVDPGTALDDYATLLQTGKSGGTEFATGPVVKSVRDNAAGQAKQVAKIATFTQKHAVTDDPVHVLRTADGGALVVGAIERTDEFTVKKGAGHLTPPAAYKALAGGVAKITKRATVTTVQVVAMVIPPKGGGSVHVVAFSELPAGIKAS